MAARAFLRGTGCALLLLVTACTASSGSTGSLSGSATPTGVADGPALSWAQVALPPGVEPLTLASLGDRLLIGGVVGAPATAPDAVATASPRMLTLAADGSLSVVPLTPHSPYAPEAAWTSVVTRGPRILAIGGARGGAHANVRWTVWSGTAAGVDELPQDFSVFGGWGAGDLVAAVSTAQRDVLVGTWGGAQTGLDAVTYPRSGDVFARQDPAGTALESTPQILVGPRGAVQAGDGILIAGSAVHLGQGAVTQLAAVWRSDLGASGWRRVDLPEPGLHSEAVSAACDGTRCTVAGHVDGALARWVLDGERVTRVPSLPPVPVGDNDPLPAPLTVEGHEVQLVGEEGNLVALTGQGGGWRRSVGPAGSPVAATLLGSGLYAVLAGQTGAPATLWRADVGPWR